MATNDDFPELDAPVDGDTPDGVPDILVGPVQRFRGAGGEATVFLELSAACEVELRAGGDDPVTTRARTWELRGHHYVLLMVSGLPDDRAVPYEVWLGDTLVWPDPARDHPPSVFAPPADHRLRLSFGSCRELGPYDEDGLDQWGADALVGLSRRLQSSDHGDFPHLLLHLGDQVYADEPSPDIADRLRELHRDIHDDAREEIRNFEEYTWLYHTTWMHPDVRWLLSTVPNAMILDDHDLRDDWNTSASWRRDVQTQPWWRDRVIGGLASYWVYQHIGNLSPAELHDDPVFAAVTTQPPDEAWDTLEQYAWRADTEPDSARWSFARDLGPARLLVVDSRCSRVLDPPEQRALVDDVEWAWLRERALAATDTRHVLIATTLPVFLPYGVHHLETWNEAVSTGAWGRACAWAGEHIRQAVDLEHWPAYHRSFVAMVDLLGDLVRRPDPPASILMMSGDVHFSYTARVELLDAPMDRTAVHQLVQSPMRNALPKVMVGAFWTFQTWLSAQVLRPLPRLAGVGDPAAHWRFDGPLEFENGVMTVHLDDDRADVVVSRARVDDDGREYLIDTATKKLTTPLPPARPRWAALRRAARAVARKVRRGA